MHVLPALWQVLLKSNSFFRVTARLEGEVAKRAQVPDLAGYSMEDLDVYLLKQI